MSVVCDDTESPSPWRQYQERRTPAVVVPISQLRPADSPRTGGESAEHVRVLVESDAYLPPIIVHRPTMRVIDGMHRLRAAVLRAHRDIEVRFFDGDADDAFVIAVEANIANCLSLSLVDRRMAAARIIATHPQRSDRWIGLVSGLAANTIGALRRCSTVDDAQSNTRTGRDGRRRPLDSSEGRRLAGELMRANPERSLRDVARAAGIAPSTALDVRNRLNSGEDLVPRKRNRGTGAVPGRAGIFGRRHPRLSRADPEVDPAAVLRNLRNDPSLRFSEAGRALLRWLDAHTVDKQLMEPLVAGIPAHCITTVVALARHNAHFWADLGEQLSNVEPEV
ncbi:MAG: ParB/RepB/Spo0J family partition protein [Pseudonocardia sp.]